MSETMALAGLVETLQDMLGEAGKKFLSPDGADFRRHLAVAVRDYSRLRPRTLSATVTLIAEQPNYAAPLDLLRPKVGMWGVTQRRAVKPWDAGCLSGPLPRLSLVGQEIWLDPPPSSAQISAFGSCYQFFYFAAHALGEAAAETSVPEIDRPVLMIRAVSAALSELAAQNHNRPVQLGGQMASVPRNGTPAALADQFFQLFERMAV